MRRWVLLGMLCFMGLGYSAVACVPEDAKEPTSGEQSQDGSSPTDRASGRDQAPGRDDPAGDQGPPSSELYNRLGSAEGIRKVVKDFIKRVVGDTKINGYFLNQGLDSKKFEDCLVNQIAALAGGPEKYTCRNMKDTHRGMGISKQDFDDTAKHLVDALKAAKVQQKDIDVLVKAVAGMEGDIVEDPSNQNSVYQRIGRLPVIARVITDFAQSVLADAKLQPFFAKTDPKRLGACLIRQVCKVTGGPCAFGKELNVPGVDNAKPCATDMKALHKDMKIANADFIALAAHLVNALKKSKVAQKEIDTIIGVIGRTCPDIVETDPHTCGKDPDALYKALGQEKGIRTVVKDFIQRVVGDAKINGYFLNQGVDAQKLEDCLVKQIGEAAGGPQKYDCRSMKDTHKGMGISKQDFDDTAKHLVDALKAAKVGQQDIDALVKVVVAMEGDIVEDPKSDQTVYQRIGRQPAIVKVVEEFAKAVLADTTLQPFFSSADPKRLGACLVRQLCEGTGGPCKFGKEANVPDVANAKPCVTDMKTLHAGMQIAKADFDKLLGHAVAALQKFMVPQAEIDAISKVLAPMCKDIVETDADKCP